MTNKEMKKEYKEELSKLNKEDRRLYNAYDLRGELKINAKEGIFEYEGTMSGLLINLSYLIDKIIDNTQFSKYIIKRSVDLGIRSAEDPDSVSIKEGINYRIEVMKEVDNFDVDDFETEEPLEDTLDKLKEYSETLNDGDKENLEQLMKLLKTIVENNKED